MTNAERTEQIDEVLDILYSITGGCVDFSVDELADICECDASTIRYRLDTALKKLQKKPLIKEARCLIQKEKPSTIHP